MKFINIPIYGAIAIMFFNVACSGPRTVSLNSMRPAEITLPSYTKTLLILDRTKSDKSVVNIVEGILTGELPGEEKTGTQELLSALSNQLGYSDRFHVLTAEERLDGNSVTSAFPEQLSWEVINKLSEKYQADAVVSIELFDTDFIVTRGRKNIKEKVGDQEVQVLKYYAQGIGNITIGIRLYDARGQTIVDQQLFADSHTWEAYGNSIPEALIQLTSKGKANRYLSQQVGTDYAYKISPMPIKIRRSFRGKSKRSPELEQGTRYADVAQWQEALEVWESGLDVARNKEAGYLAHNIAIAYEVLGDFDNALYWAETAYVRYGNKDSRTYVNQIKRRLSSEELAQRQLELGTEREN